MIKILFVDDEIYMLEAMKRILKKKTDEWEMIFVSSGKEAIEHLNKKEFDIIVTDYKMPEMDGLELLSYVKERFGNMKKIILSGQSGAEIYNKAKEVSDIYLDKPCEPEALINVLEEVAKNNIIGQH